MHSFSNYVQRKVQHILSYSFNKAGSLLRFQRVICVYLYRFILLHIHSFFIQLLYFIILSLLGYLALKALRPKSSHAWPNDFDLFFTSLSVSTLSSISVIEAEVFSNNQLIIIIILILLGGKIFTSMIGLIFAWFNLPMYQSNKSGSGSSPNSRNLLEDQVVLCGLSTSDSESQSKINQVQNDNVDTLNLRNSMRYMGYVVLGYQIIAQSIGFILVFMYLSIELNAKEILRNKNLNIVTFSVLITVSSFNNCGFVPINENMRVFMKNSGLLLLLMPQILLGNTLYPPCLRLVTWVLGKCTKKDEFFYILKDHRDVGYNHMLSRARCCKLTVTVLGLLVTQLSLLCALELNSNNTVGLNSYQKFITFLFQATNCRHAGESILDLSIVSSAMMVVFILMMYLPPYTTFSPIWNEQDCNRNYKKSGNLKKFSIMESLVLSQISYLAISVILICITERDKLERDPLNFNLLSTMVEVVGAYGNVGFSTGHRCERQLEPDGGRCKQTWTNLAAHYSIKGKAVLILVMLFGKLKNFNCNGGKAWALY